MKKRQEHGREIYLDELKVLQMDILSAIDEYCRDNNIRYSLACGSLLGAIRHKGYIPWDDDIDIYIPREDYNRLIAEFPELYKDRYRLISLERDKLWERPYANAYDDKTILLENAKEKKTIGVNIDIFPIDDVPIGDDWMKYDNKRRRLIQFFSLQTVRVSQDRSYIKNVIVVFVRLVSFFYSTRRWAFVVDRMAKKYNGKGMTHCFETCQGIFQKKPFEKSLFDDLDYIPFEDRKFKAFRFADIYLRNGYGDYMQLPPEGKRVSHHAFTAYWKE